MLRIHNLAFKVPEVGVAPRLPLKPEDDVEAEMALLHEFAGIAWAVFLAGTLTGCVLCLAAAGKFSRFFAALLSPSEKSSAAGHIARRDFVKLLTEMRFQSEDGNFSRVVAVEGDTEVGQIAAEYNKVLQRVVSEIAQREDVVKKLRVAEEKYRTIFENATEGIFRSSPQSRYLDANPAQARMLGYETPEALLQVRNIRSQIYVSPSSRDLLMQKLATDRYVKDFETSMYRRDGSIVHISINARMAQDEFGEPCVEGSMCDITERRRAERFREEKEAAEAANRAKSTFLAAMSHEIRTPLNGVIGMLELLSSSEQSEQQVRYTGIAKSSAQALLSLINDILDISKIEAGKLELSQTEFPLSSLLEEISEMFAHRAQDKGLELCCHVLADVPKRVRGDAERLRQILINLLGNALKFTEKGHVRLRVSTAGSSGIRFEVHDTGVGIPAEVQKRLFQAFEQADSSTTRKYGGTGLGLAICRQLAELMGGKIGVVSNVGEGAQFWCELPLAVVTQAPVPEPQRSRLTDLSVLAVDDNETNLQILETYLGGWRAQVKTCRDAEAAVGCLREAAAQNHPVELIVIDREMPEIDGLELAHLIRNDVTLPRVPVILLTAADDSLTSDTMRKLGIRACCPKPILQSRLFDAVMLALHGEHTSGKAAASNPASVSLSPSTSTARILVADDNEINRMVAQEMVERAGFQCQIVSEGAAAIQALQESPFDVVLMDCQMPVMDGFTATREIRRLESVGGLHAHLPVPLPIIALTANAVMGDRERCLAAGMTDYLTKPIDPVRLGGVLRRLLQKRRGPPLPTTELTEEPVTKVAVIDWDSLKDRCGGDTPFAIKILDKFRGRLAEDWKAISAAWENRDVEESRRLAHSLKGVASSVSALAIAQAAAAIEQSAGHAQEQATSAHVRELKERLDECLQFMEQGTEAALT